ncbi:MAG TPA: tRNA (adenosine(37)-N6)-threonylcarbamoyltransferase complex dimerization subunit type 1 TsaB [Ignavibacteria bacterium]|nr:tRNA (adenosine(37)-N6)-threonylcarbamoyltransferase complex dimerization subunit type 1 TsaB [Ignavibacteria bacterium]
MNFLLINSNENDAFAGMHIDDTFDIVKCSEFAEGNQKPRRSPDKLINCLVKLRGKYDFHAVDAISVTIGPGSFTGIRVGLALAKGIAGGLNKPLVPINNFDLLYERIPYNNRNTKYCILIPAKHPEYYYSLIQNSKQEITGCLNIDEIFENIDKKTIIAGDFGNETILKHSYFTYINLINSDSNEPDAMLKLTQKYFAEVKTEEAENVEPLYLKDFNFKKNTEGTAF